MRLAKENDFLCLPGSMFGGGQEDYLRFAFANVEEEKMALLAERLGESCGWLSCMKCIYFANYSCKLRTRKFLFKSRNQNYCNSLIFIQKSVFFSKPGFLVYNITDYRLLKNGNNQEKIILQLVVEGIYSAVQYTMSSYGRSGSRVLFCVPVAKKCFQSKKSIML